MPGVVVADILLIVVPGLMGWMPWGESLYRGMTVLVAASPCAIALGAVEAAMLSRYRAGGKARHPAEGRCLA